MMTTLVITLFQQMLGVSCKAGLFTLYSFAGDLRGACNRDGDCTTPLLMGAYNSLPLHACNPDTIVIHSLILGRPLVRLLQGCGPRF